MLTRPFSNMSALPLSFFPECSSVGFTIRYILQMSCSTATYIVGKEGPSRAPIFSALTPLRVLAPNKKVFLKFFFSLLHPLGAGRGIRGRRRKNEKDCSPSLPSLGRGGEQAKKRKKGRRRDFGVTDRRGLSSFPLLFRRRRKLGERK